MKKNDHFEKWPSCGRIHYEWNEYPFFNNNNIINYVWHYEISYASPFGFCGLKMQLYSLFCTFVMKFTFTPSIWHHNMFYKKLLYIANILLSSKVQSLFTVLIQLCLRHRTILIPDSVCKIANCKVAAMPTPISCSCIPLRVLS